MNHMLSDEGMEVSVPLPGTDGTYALVEAPAWTVEADSRQIEMRQRLDFGGYGYDYTYVIALIRGTSAFTLMLGVAATLLGCLALSAADTESKPFPGVRYVHRQVTEPREIDMHIVILDLKQPGLSFVSTDQNGELPGETDLETTRAFVKRTGVQIGINSGFFGRLKGELLDGAHGGADLCSLAVSGGARVSDWGTWIRDAVNIGRDNTVTFVSRAKDDTTGYMTTPEVELYNALSGNARLLRDGVVLPGKGGDTTYPQTAVGCTADHRLILFVSDGRQPGFSAGMTYEEVAVVLKEFGAVDAIAFDGGGSATMVMADDKGGEPRILNRPSDGQERAVGNNLGVRVSPPLVTGED